MKFFVKLPHFGLLKLSGSNAKQFLQGQVTCDLNELNPDITLLGGYCNLQGRLIAVFYLTEVNHELYLCLPREIIPKTLKKLSKYAVFSKVTLTDVSDDHIGIGVKDSAVSGSIHFRCADPISRHLLFLTQQEYDIFINQHPELPQQPEPTWHQLDIAAGIPWIYAKTQEELLPHRVNLHLLKAVSFKKGCYVGQEIIARMQYRGTLKHHMYRLSLISKALPSLGEPLEIPDTKQKVGIVVDAEWVGADQIEVLAVLQDSEIPQSDSISRLPLP